MAIGFAWINNSAFAQDPSQLFVTPGPNRNVVGFTPNPTTLAIPDLFRKQQNEPACVQATDNPAEIVCGFNDCRAADWPDVQGDCWIGVGQSRDFGETWTSRLAPGYNLHPHSIGMGFAADPALVEMPGNSPGMMLLTYIASYRDSDVGGIYTQAYVKSPLDDGEPYLPRVGPPTEVASGSEGRFHDKVAAIYIINDDDPQSTTPETVMAEGISEEININRVDGVHIVAYSVFTGEGSAVKILTTRSLDGGKTYERPKKASAELNTVTGVHLSYIPGKGLSLTYRRSADSNETDAIMQAFSTNLGRTWSKADVVYRICPHDQPATGASARSFTFPWSADDGERFWVFSADKVDPNTGERIFTQGNCTQVAGAPPGTFPGVSRIVGMSSLDGTNWYGSVENPDEPFILDLNSGFGHQVFPFTHGVKERLDIAWYDTREEDELLLRPPPVNPDGTPAPELPLIYDYVTNDNGIIARVFRTANIYTTRISGCKATTPAGACTPHLPADDDLVAPVRVSRYQTFNVDENTVQEIEANRLNLRTHGSGKLAYFGDYGSMGTRRFRRTPSGKVIQNSLGRQAQEGETVENFVDNENVFMAWGDNRDVLFGGAVENPADPDSQFLYSPPENAAPGLQAPGFQANSEDVIQHSVETLLVEETQNENSLKAVNEPDDETGQGPLADFTVCSANNNFSRTRDSNVYGSLVEDVPSLVALSQVRPMNTTQRMFPLEIYHPGTAVGNYCLVLTGQPADATVEGVLDPSILIVSGAGRASFEPLPAVNAASGSPARVQLDVEVPPLGRAARSVFVTSGHPNTRITVNAYNGTCAAPGSIVSSVQLGNGQLFDPLFCQQDPVPESCLLPVTSNETHNIELVAPGLQAPGLQAPGLQAPVLQAPTFQADPLASPVLQAPVLQAPGLQAPGFQAEGEEAPVLQAPSYQAPGFQAETFEANSLISPSLQAPSFQAPSLQAAVEGDNIYYQDLTYVVLTSGNGTSTYSADIAVVGVDPDNTAIELIAWQPNVHTTTVADPNTCVALPQADNDVIAAVNMGSPGLQAPGLQAPSLGDVSLPFAFAPEDDGSQPVPVPFQQPYNGDITFTGKPGDLVNLTVRFWVTDVPDPTTGMSMKEVLERLHECSTAEVPDPSLNCLPQEIKNGAFLLVPFGAAAHGCNTADVGNTNPNIDCISAGAEKIEPPDLFAPVFDPPDGGAVAHEAELDGNGDCCAVNTPDTVPAGISVTDQDPDVTVSCTSASVTLVDGTTLFPFGSIDVDCTAIDTSLNQSNATITISIIDTIDPVISVPADITGVGAVDLTGAFVAYEVTAADTTETTIACTVPDGNGGIPVNSNGDTFLPGTTTVTCTATDQGGNTDTGTFDITVVDIGNPTITVSVTSPQPKEAEGPNGAPVDFDVTASDAIDDSVATECTRDDTGTVVVSGSTFPYVAPDPTMTSVTCTATDDAGNTASTSFNVTVDDTTPPDLTVPDDITATVGATVDYADYGLEASDIVDSDPVITCVPPSGSTFDAVGTTNVSCTATDNSNNTSAAGTFDIVVDVAPGGIDIKRVNKTGSSAPVRWTWEDSDENPIDVGVSNHDIEAREGVCSPTNTNPDVILEDPGSSGFQQFTGNIFGYNWQLVDQDGADLPGGSYCVKVILTTTGQSQEADTTIR